MNMKFICIFYAIVLCFFIGIHASSSPENRDIANQNYPDSPVERFVATHLGDEFPNMRDDLIKRKNNGEGFVERHKNAWKNRRNW